MLWLYTRELPHTATTLLLRALTCVTVGWAVVWQVGRYQLWDDAVRTYRTLLSVQPTDAMLWQRLGICYSGALQFRQNSLVQNKPKPSPA